MAQPADGGSEHATPQMATRDLRASSWSGWTGFKTDGVLDRQLTRSAADRAQQHHDEAADREHLREPEPERPFQQHESIVCDVAPQRRKTLARIAAHRRELGVHVAPQRRKPFPHLAPHGGELGPHFSTQIADLALQILTHDTSATALRAGAIRLYPFRPRRRRCHRHVATSTFAGDICTLPFFSSVLAIASRCTSSGPSASRSVRVCAHIAASGKSSQTPAAPCAWMARSSTRSVIRGTTTLTIASSFRAALLQTVSISEAAFIVSSRACSISIRDSAMSARIVPCSASGRPKAMRL